MIAFILCGSHWRPHWPTEKERVRNQAEIKVCEQTTAAPKTSGKRQQQQQPAMPGPALWSGECLFFFFFLARKPRQSHSSRACRWRWLWLWRAARSLARSPARSRARESLCSCKLHFRMPSLLRPRSVAPERSGNNNKLSL